MRLDYQIQPMRPFPNVTIVGSDPDLNLHAAEPVSTRALVILIASTCYLAT